VTATLVVHVTQHVWGHVGISIEYGFFPALYVLLIYSLDLQILLLLQKCCELTVLKQIGFIRGVRTSLILACRIWNFKFELLTHGQGIFQLNSHFCVFLYYTWYFVCHLFKEV
jgi:hypothetical protein